MIDLANISGMQDTYLLQKQVEMIIESSNKKLLQEITMLKGSVQRLNEEILELKREKKSVLRVPASRVSEMITIEEKQPEGGKESVIQPRYGKYGPQDAAIDKFFYFGKK
jgi:hypothetical protein